MKSQVKFNDSAVLASELLCRSQNINILEAIPTPQLSMRHYVITLSLCIFLKSLLAQAHAQAQVQQAQAWALVGSGIPETGAVSMPPSRGVVCSKETENWQWPEGVKLLAVKHLTKSDIDLKRGALSLRSTQGENIKDALGGVGEVDGRSCP